MKITAIQVENLRGFNKIEKTELSRTINVFIGSNNAGKTTILNSIFHLQRPNLGVQDITIGKTIGEVRLYFEGQHLPNIPPNPESNAFVIDLKDSLINFGQVNGGLNSWGSRMPEQEPDNLIYPYLSKRKTAAYVDNINETNANSVTGNFSNLYSKVDRLVTPQFQPGNKKYVEACEDILGFQVSSLAKGNGKQAVYFVYNLEHIPLTSMGEGVANVLGLITDLCVAEERIFLIEEPENDIHPKALKALLKLIIEKSDTNQFFVSTHSNIVMKYLGAANSAKIFYVNSKIGLDITRPKLFVSTLNEVSNNSEERRNVLQELGYDFFDFDLWSCWLFLEESSAEVLIKNYFIGWYIKSLSNRLRTFSAGGYSEIIPKFEDFDRLFIFLHLEPTYKNKVWVIIDKGIEEDKIIERMRTKYSKSGWSPSNFTQFEEHDFEKYYPSRFQKKVTLVLKIEDKQGRRNAKKGLLDEVIVWIKENELTAKEEFKVSAKEVIDRLKIINREIGK